VVLIGVRTEGVGISLSITLHDTWFDSFVKQLANTCPTQVIIHCQTQRSKQTSKIFWDRGVLKPIDEHKNPSLKEKFKNPNHKF
jgi:hypothetical protein